MWDSRLQPDGQCACGRVAAAPILSFHWRESSFRGTHALFVYDECLGGRFTDDIRLSAVLFAICTLDPLRTWVPRDEKSALRAW